MLPHPPRSRSGGAQGSRSLSPCTRVFGRLLAASARVLYYPGQQRPVLRSDKPQPPSGHYYPGGCSTGAITGCAQCHPGFRRKSSGPEQLASQSPPLSAEQMNPTNRNPASPHCIFQSNLQGLVVPGSRAQGAPCKLKEAPRLPLGKTQGLCAPAQRAERAHARGSQRVPGPTPGVWTARSVITED